MQIDVTSQIPALHEHATEIRNRLGSLTPLMQAIMGVIEGSTRERFSTKQSPNGVAWAELMPATVKAKNGRTNILVDSGDLMRSITGFASENEAVIGTDRPYAKYSQTGTKNADGSTRMVARPIFGLSIQNKTDITQFLNDFMAGNL